MEFEILAKPPISGTIVERHFDVSAGSNLWVRFAEPEGDDWVGVFGDGLTRFDAVVPFGDDPERTVLVIAGGRGYIIDLSARTLVRRTTWDDADHAISVPHQAFVVVARCIRVLGVGRADERNAIRTEMGWYDYPGKSGPTGRIALDGIVFTAASPTQVEGRLWDGDGWYAFTLTLPQLTVTRGKLLAPEWDAFGPVPPAG